MQTNFSEDQLKDKDNKSTEKIIRKCVHCGMCNATCPTFNILGDELDGPRGRIYLIKEMIEKKKTPTKKVNETRSSRNKARSRSQKLKWTKEINTRR